MSPGPAPRRLPPALVALTPGELRSGGGGLGPAVGLSGVGGAAAWLQGLERALEAGLPGVLVREPQLLDGHLARLLEPVAQACERTGAWLGVHDRAHLARACGAHGLHLGFRSLTPDAARRAAGEDLALGLSTHAGDLPESWAACDYRSLSPVYGTPSKAGLLEPLGPAAFGSGVATSPCPTLALGGVTPERVGELRRAGASGLLVRGALLKSRDPGAATAAFLRAWEAAA